MEYFSLPLSKKFFVDLLPEIQRRSDSIKNIKNLIRSEIFQNFSLKILLFVEVVQGQCCIFRG